MPFVKRLNTHQTHFEDLVLLGPDGLEELNDKIEGTIDTLENESGRLNLTTKIDGAPAMICWSSYPGYPDNSIALKGFISGPQNAISSPDQVDAKYGDRPGMSQMLKYGLELAKHIPAGEAWQGDCLFVGDTKREEEINGKDYITFQPNKIIYAFSEDNPGYEKVKNADFGIAFHTIYTGEDKKQSFKVDASKLNVPSNIYIMSPSLNKPTDKKVFNLDKVKAQFDKLEDLEQKLLSNFEYEDLVNNRVFMGYWNTFENANLADKKSVTINENTFINDLKEYIKSKRTKEYETQVGKLKTDAGKEKAKTKYEQDLVDLQELVETNKELLTTLVQTLNCAATIKMLLWQGFKQTQFDYNTFYRSRTKGYIPGEMEGVAMSDQDGNIVKIVDRSTFSSYNRDPDIMSGFEHPENLTEEQQCFIEEYNNELTECGSKQLWERFGRLLESDQKTAVVAFGRMNPPTIGHQKLVDKMASLAQGEKAKLFLSHTQDKKKNPLSYEQKIRYAKEAFEPKIDVVDSPARTVIEVLADLYSQGYTDIIYVGGEDRIGGSEDISSLILRYNGQPTKDGKIVYDFNSIKFEVAGEHSSDAKEYTYEYIKDHLDGLDLRSAASASLSRACAVHNDYELFKKFSPLPESETQDLFQDVMDGLGIKGTTTLHEDKFKEIISGSDKSLDDIYHDLAAGLLQNKETRGRVEKIISRISELTNSIDEAIFNIGPILTDILKPFGKDLDILSLMQKLSPSDAEVIRDIHENHDKAIDLKNSGNLYSCGLSKPFIDYVFNLRPFRVGRGEVLLALLGGKKPDRGDIKLNGIDYEVKDVSSGGASYNQADAKFNTTVDKLFKNLLPKTTSSGNQGTLRASDLKGVSLIDDDGTSILPKIIGDNSIEVSSGKKINLDNIKDGSELFNLLAVEAAENACGPNGKFIVFNGAGEYEVLSPIELVNNKDIVLTSKAGDSTNRSFKILKGRKK